MTINKDKHKTMTINKAIIITKILLHTQYNDDTKHNITNNYHIQQQKCNTTKLTIQSFKLDETLTLNNK